MNRHYDFFEGKENITSKDIEDFEAHASIMQNHDFCDTGMECNPIKINRKGINVKIGQHFLSQSKVQTFPVEYIFYGVASNGEYNLHAANGNTEEDIKVEEEGFNQRKIKIC